MNAHTREAWLEKATDLLRVSLFKANNIDLPKVRVSVGFPGGVSARKRIGEHWHPRASEDGVSQIFISPRLKSSLEHLDVLVHELVHACVPDDGHGAAFKRIALAVGLTGPMRSTVAGEVLRSHLNALIQGIGEIPHAAINLGMGRKKQSTRLLKVECPACGYTVRVTQKWLEMGAPICPTDHEPMEQSQ